MLIICLGFSITRRAARAMHLKEGEQSGRKYFGNGKCDSVNSLRISAPQW